MQLVDPTAVFNSYNHRLLLPIVALPRPRLEWRGTDVRAPARRQLISSEMSAPMASRAPNAAVAARTVLMSHTMYDSKCCLINI